MLHSVRPCAGMRKDRSGGRIVTFIRGLPVMLDAHGYWLTRLVFKTGLGLVYLTAFIVALNQFRPLLGERGLLPVPAFVKQVSFSQTPSLFFFWPKDAAFAAAAWLGIAFACLAISGLADRYSWSSML